jgi:hypothetical protein
MGAVRNDTAWSIFNFTARITQDTLTISNNSGDFQRSEMIGFKLKFHGTDNYPLAPANLIYAYAPGVDNPAISYTPDPNFDNFFNVTSYDADSGVISGTFSVKFNKDPSNQDGRYPVSVSFLTGAFRIHLSK